MYTHKQKLLDIIKANGNCNSIKFWYGCNICPIDYNRCKFMGSNSLKKDEALKIYRAYRYKLSDIFDKVL